MQIILLLGQIGAGKTTFANFFAEETNGRVLSTSKLLAGDDRSGKQAHGDELDDKTAGAWVADAIVPVLKAAGDKSTIIVDCVRRKSQILHIRKRWPNEVFVIGVRTSGEVLQKHLSTRNLDVEGWRALSRAMEHPVERALPMDECDIIIDNRRYDSKRLTGVLTRQGVR